MLKNWKIGSRLYAGFGVLLVLMAAMTAISWWRLSAADEDMRRMMAEPLTKERLVSDWYRLIHTSVRRTTAIIKSSDPSLATHFAAETAESSRQISQMQKQVEQLLRDTEEHARFDALGETRKRYLKARDDASGLKQSDPEQAVKVFDERFKPAGEAYVAGLESLLAYQRSQIDAMANAIDQSSQAARTRLLMLGVFSALLGAYFALAITRSITRPLQRSVDASRRVAAGDLSAIAEGDARDDETGQLLKSLAVMQRALAAAVTDIRQSTDSIGVASAEIATGNADLSVRTELTASNLQLTAAAMEQLTAGVRSTAECANTANQLANTAQTSAAKGDAVVASVVSTMAGINASSKKIGDIVSLIDGIAFQTNILALNAAVEAARAGEHGRGFAVVAGEVRNLAQRSADSAKEIKRLISDSVQEVETGSQLVADAGKTMQEIMASVESVSRIIGDISRATSEQRGGIDQVNASVSQLDQMTQQNSALVEESAAAAESLHEQSRRLTESVKLFTV